MLEERSEDDTNFRPQEKGIVQGKDREYGQGWNRRFFATNPNKHQDLDLNTQPTSTKTSGVVRALHSQPTRYMR